MKTEDTTPVRKQIEKAMKHAELANTALLAARREMIKAIEAQPESDAGDKCYIRKIDVAAEENRMLTAGADMILDIRSISAGLTKVCESRDIIVPMFGR